MRTLLTMSDDPPSSPEADAALRALDRLEAALEDLFGRVEARFVRMEEERVPRAEVEELSRRLDDALEKLRAAMADGGE